jgi:hypothetical protein
VSTDLTTLTNIADAQDARIPSRLPDAMQESHDFQGLELDDQLSRRQVAPWCSLLVIDTRNGDVVEKMRLGAEFGGLFVGAADPAMRCAIALAPNSLILRDAITFEKKFGRLANERSARVRQVGEE